MRTGEGEESLQQGEACTQPASQGRWGHRTARYRGTSPWARPSAYDTIYGPSYRSAHLLSYYNINNSIAVFVDDFSSFYGALEASVGGAKPHGNAKCSAQMNTQVMEDWQGSSRRYPGICGLGSLSERPIHTRPTAQAILRLRDNLTFSSSPHSPSLL